MRVERFEDLTVWQKARERCVEVSRMIAALRASIDRA
jgi:hypothetical protein